MANLLSFMDFVKGQASFHENMAEKTKADKQNPKRSPKHQKTAQDFHALGAAMIESQAEVEAAKAAVAKIPAAAPAQDQHALTLRPEDLSGLPAELLKQLKITEGDRLEAAIVEIINAAGGTLILDKLLIGLYRKTGEIHQRSTLVGRLYRMSQKDLVFSVPKKKGVYTTNPELGVPAEEVSEEAT